MQMFTVDYIDRTVSVHKKADNCYIVKVKYASSSTVERDFPSYDEAAEYALTA